MKEYLLQDLILKRHQYVNSSKNKAMFDVIEELRTYTFIKMSDCMLYYIDNDNKIFIYHFKFL